MKTNKSLTIKIDDLLTVEALTDMQASFFNNFRKNAVVSVLYGSAGTGKTFIGLYKALEHVLDRSYPQDRVIVLRSAVAARDIGALPGDEQEKAAVYELPYMDMCTALFDKGDAYTRLKEQGKLKFAITSYIRGITFDKSIIVVDEVQNMNYQELYSVMTRVGVDTRIIFCGDFRQTDLRDSGLQKFLNVLRCIPEVQWFQFTTDDIVRSDIVRKFIIAEESFKL